MTKGRTSRRHGRGLLAQRLLLRLEDTQQAQGRGTLHPALAQRIFILLEVLPFFRRVQNHLQGMVEQAALLVAAGLVIAEEVAVENPRSLWEVLFPKVVGGLDA